MSIKKISNSSLSYIQESYRGVKILLNLAPTYIFLAQWFLTWGNSRTSY